MIWRTFEGFFLLLDSLKRAFNFGKMSRGGGGFGLAKNFGAVFWGNFYHFRLFKSPRINLSVQRLNSFLVANNMTFYAVLSDFSKCHNLRVKVLHDCPK